MIDFLNSFKSLVKLETIHTDNNIFKLHYKITVIMLIVFSILLTSKQYFGDPIDCDVQERKNIINTYCWIFGTYTLKRYLGEKILPGVGNDPNIAYLDQLKNSSRPDDRLYQKYYQWICIVFCVQALFFYLPRYMWKTWEGGRLRHLVKDLSGPLVTPSWNINAREKLISYLLSGKYSHNMYALRYSLCEIFNLINVIGQIHLIDWFLNGHFARYGIALFESEINPMTMLFPKMTKCTYYNYGPSGGIQIRDALCILPLNVLNEKLFLILWFWLHILSLVTILALIYRLLFLMSVRFRCYLLMGQTMSSNKSLARTIVKEITFGDFFVLYNVGKNVNPVIYKELVQGVHDYVNKKTPFSPEMV